MRTLTMYEKINGADVFTDAGIYGKNHLEVAQYPSIEDVGTVVLLSFDEIKELYRMVKECENESHSS